tara:strand:+ start:12 stop:722 length:711 start_codon:yes stop_codon:yes gene_type:complete
MVGGDMEDTIKASFRRAKEHIEALEAEIRANREFIISQNKQFNLLNSQIQALQDQILTLEAPKLHISKDLTLKKEQNKPVLEQKEAKISSKSVVLSHKSEDSIRNKGVSLDGYSLPGYSLPGYSLDIQAFKDNLQTTLSKLSRQEFLTFLTIYQQEEQGQVTYSSVAQELKLSTGCIRTYVSGLIKKGLPVVKTKFNNKLIILSVPSEIRGLNLKKKIIQVFYNLDPNQTKLGSDF